MKEQIEEMFNIIVDGIIDGEDNNGVPTGNTCEDIAEALYNAGYRKQKEGEWIKYAESYGCTACKESFYVYGYAEDYDPITDFDLHFCPNCGAKMGGGAE